MEQYDTNEELFDIRNNRLNSMVNKTDSSSESNDIKLTDIYFELIKKDNACTSYYTVDQLSQMPFNVIYNILTNVSYLIFIDNIKLQKSISNKCSIFKKKHLLDTDFPNCTFFPYEIIDMLKKNIHTLNNNILNAESKRQKIYDNEEEICYGISFDEGDIIKNRVYKKTEIIDMIMFIPIDKYNIKQTEYKIRGFCQIVEELGAKSIDITFKKNHIVNIKKNIDAALSSDIKIMAINLGLSVTNINETDENYQYTLTYPSSNMIILNEAIIRNKIKQRQFIINDANYNSNLELQYLINSRCKHMITKYSTIFTVDNSVLIDQSLLVKLKSHNIDIGMSYKTYNMDKTYLTIITNVIFSSGDDYTDILNGTNVSLDNIGFNQLINSMKNSNDFSTNGIYKIMVFINTYIDKILQNSYSSQYANICIIMKKIKKELTLSEYAELLCNHFTNKSQWIHFINFIDLLLNKTPCYDKLGYIIIVCINCSVDNKIDLMLNFIQQICIEKKIEDKFWNMIQPYNIRLKTELRHKLLYEYNFIHNYNWYNLNMLINSIETYTVNFTDMDNETCFIKLIHNMTNGFKNWEFNTSMIPFIMKQLRNIPDIIKNEMYLTSIFEKTLNIESFYTNKINKLEDLIQYINDKIDIIKNIYKWINDITYPITLEDFYNTISTTDFVETYDYLNKKIYYIIGDKTLENIKKWIQYDKITNENMIDIIKKILCYNEKLNVNNIPINYLGFTIICNNYINGDSETEFNNLVKPFILSHIHNKHVVKQIIDDIIYEDFNKSFGTYYDMFIYLKNILVKNEINISHIISQFIL
jgi:hypothetical protein